MANKPSPRVLRAYSLSLELFDHVKGVQRQLQRETDRRTGTIAREGDPTWATGSYTLSHIVQIHRLISGAAERAGLTADGLVTALVLNGVTIKAQSGAVEVQR